MQKSINSLRATFIILGLFYLIGILGFEATLLGVVSFMISLVFGGTYLYVGLKIKTLLPSKKKIVKNILHATLFLVGYRILFVILPAIIPVFVESFDSSEIVISTVALFFTSIPILIGVLIPVGVYVYLLRKIEKISDEIEQG